MARETRTGEYSIFDDPRPAIYDKQGLPITAGKIARVFADNISNSTKLEALGRATIEKCLASKTIRPHEVLTWIGDEATRNAVEIWCRGKNIKLEKKPEEAKDHAKQVLERDIDLIDTLSPYLRKIDLARLLALRHYRGEDPAHQTIVYGNYRLLGEYLGPRRHYKRDANTPTLMPLPDLPPEIFDNRLINSILLESEREAALPIFAKNPVEGFRYLNELKAAAPHDSQREFIESLEEYFHTVLDFSVPGFKSEIQGSQKDLAGMQDVQLSAFPALHQREYAYRFIHKPIGKIDYLVGDTGTMKSGGAQYALKAAGAESPIIICPSGINKVGWARELQEKLVEPTEILIIDSLSQLRSLARHAPARKPDYTIIGYQLLSRINIAEAPGLFNKLHANLGWDGFCADEVHMAKEPTSECTKQLVLLSSILPENAPRIVMTASAIVNSVEDLDAPIRSLLPYRYENPGDFTRAARNDPDLVSALLRGEQILTRWTKESLLTLPPIEYRHEPVPLTPFHQALYDFIYHDSTIEAQVKRGMLRQVSLDPLLIRRHYNPVGIEQLIENLRLKLYQRQDDVASRIIVEKMFALESRRNSIMALSEEKIAMQSIIEAHTMFKRWNQANPDAVFNEDFLVNMGYKDISLWAFFNLRGGVDALIQKLDNPELKMDWAGKKDVYSSKYLKLKELLDERILEGKTKVIIYSGFYQSQVSTGIEDLDIDDELAFLSLYDHLRSWYGDNSFLKIDGSVSVQPKAGELAEREIVRRAWRLDPGKHLLATVRSSRLGIDLSVPKTPDNQHLEKVTDIFIDLPDTYMDIDQSIGRDHRPGQDFPVEVIFLRTTNPEQPQTFRYGYIDHGMWDAIEFKRLLAQMVLDGIPLTQQEESFLKSHMSNVRMELLPTTPNAYLTNVFYRQVRGQGAKNVLDYYQRTGFEGITNGDFFTANYPLHDELSIAGHNAKAVSEIVKTFERATEKSVTKIGSVGAGAGIFQLALSRPVTNIDILSDILRVARNRLNNNGDYITGEASQLPIKDETFDFTDASFMLHWTDNRTQHQSNGNITSERISALSELNRVTRVGGLVTITVPASYLTGRQFSAWKEVLEKEFGFRFREDIKSGLMHATDFRQEAICWIFNLEKTTQAHPNLQSASALSFDFENVYDTLGTRSGKQNGPYDITPNLPHAEFQIVEPESGSTQRLVYQQDLTSIEDIILAKPTLPTDLDILANYGIEEFGTYRHAVREARTKWGLAIDDAEQLAKEALIEWAKNGVERDSGQKIWQEVQSIMHDLKEGENK